MKIKIFNTMTIILLFFVINNSYATCNGFIKENNKQGAPGTLKIVFDFNRGGIASSQYAIWIEDSNGKLVKNIYVTKFTADGGYMRREDCLPTWVYKANPEKFSMGYTDAFSGATPKSGKQTYYWNGTSDRGEILPAGEYYFYIECNLHWDQTVLYTGKVDLGGEEQSSIPVDVEYYNEGNKNKNIIKNIEVSYEP